MPDIDHTPNNSTDDSRNVPTEATRRPIVFARGGETFASSRDVAASFEKRHDDVLRAIDNLLAAAPDLRLRNFTETSIEVEMPNGATKPARSVEMTRDGFTLLAMRFTGAKALKWQLAYIEAFNAMEATLRAQRDPAAALNDPAAMRVLLLTYAEKQIELQGEIEEMRPQVQALERIALSEGSLCITDAAKTLQVQPKSLFGFLMSHGWIFTPHGGRGHVAYQAKLQSGLLEHKTTTVHRSDGSEKTVSQVRVTAKGLARLAQEFQPVARAA